MGTTNANSQISDTMIDVPDDWYANLFDSHYYLVDTIRKNPTAADYEVESIIRLTGVKPPAPVLDLACGYGRHCQSFAQKGFPVVGLDLSQDLLSFAQQHAKTRRVSPCFVHTDLRTWSPAQRHFQLVTLLDTSFGYFPCDRDNCAILDKAYQALQPRGYFILEQVNFTSSCTHWRLNEEFSLPGGLGYKKRSNLLDNGRLWVGTYEYHNFAASIVTYPFQIRLYSPEELLYMLAEPGFSRRHITVLGDYKGNMFAPYSSPVLLIVAQK